MHRKRRFRFSIPALLMTSGCAALFQPKTVNPIPFEAFGATDRVERVVIMLPGIRDRADDFIKNGFISAALPYLEKEKHTTLLAVDAHWGYYRERIVDIRLKEDILQRYSGARFSYVGASLGGFGSLLMASQQPERTDRLTLLAPLLGEDDYSYLERLKSEGPADRDGDEELITALNRIWRFLLDPGRRVPITIAYGKSDSFAPYYEHLQSLNPANLEIIAVPGGHDWKTWRRLWDGLAEQALSPR